MTKDSTECRLEYCQKPASTKKQQLCSGHDAQMRRGKPFKELGVAKYEAGTLCSFTDCGRPVKNFGLCVAHYTQQRRGIPLKPLLAPGETPNRCSLEGCQKFGNWRGLCVEHQKQADAGLQPYIVQRVCAFDGCERNAKWKELCVAHGEQRRKGRELRPIRRKRDHDIPCGFPGCGKDVYAVGLCSGHYGQKSKGRELTPIKHVPRRVRRTTEQIAARDDRGRKQCRKCGMWWPESLFYSNRNVSDGLNPECRACCQAKTANSREQSRARQIKRIYNITVEKFDTMFAAQGNVCGSCGSDDRAGANWAIDHDHACCPRGGSCGACVRGILCNPCNLALGIARDDANRLRAMADYLDSWDKRKTLKLVA